MGQGKTHPTSIIILGGGTAGWMTAAALANFLPSGCLVTLVESEEIGTIGVGESTIPQMTVFNQGLGIDEAEFVRETQATFKLGIQFDDWLVPGQGYFHSFGKVGRDLGLVPFQHYWLRSRALGNPNDLASYCANSVAAAAGRFGKPSSRDGFARLGFAYAYHIDAFAYAAFLRRYAQQRGVSRIEGKVVEVERDARKGMITGLKLANGQRVLGDFFFDCSGLSGLLINKTLGVPFEDWSHWLVCDRAWAVPSKQSGPLDPFTRATARKFGWQWRIPLQHRIGNGLVYSSRHATDEEALALLTDNVSEPLLQEPRALRFTTGRRVRQWDANCIAIGLSGGFLEPLEATSIYLIQSGIARALRYFPSSTEHDSERAAYNAETENEYAAIRDFLILHYHANARHGEPLWDECRDMKLPDSLARKVELFKSSARIFRENLELFDVASWLQVMLGQGIVPEGYNPLANRVDEKQLRQTLDEVAAACRNLADRLPTMEDYIARSGGAAR